MGKITSLIGIVFMIIGVIMISDAFGNPKETSTIEGGLGIIFVLFIGIGLIVAGATRKKDNQ